MKIILFLLVFITVGKLNSQEPGYEEISLPELMKLKAEGRNDMLILDVRTNGEYHDSSTANREGNIGRIRGARHIPLQQLRTDSNALAAYEAYRDKPVYLICSHSYRSRDASLILKRRGFTRVNNVRGGMTEWFRRSSELEPYRKRFWESKVPYQLVSPAALWESLSAGKKIKLLVLHTEPRTFYDSLNQNLSRFLPLFKAIQHYSLTDSSKILHDLQQSQQDQVVILNHVRNGAAGMVAWLSDQGIRNVGYLVGSMNYFNEYLSDKGLSEKALPYLSFPARFGFVSAGYLCNTKNSREAITWVDIRHDSLYGKERTGIKYNYRYVQNAIHFGGEHGADAFIQKFPDRNRHYVLLSLDGYRGIELAEKLAEKGYKISWLIGGILRLEWYTINMEQFDCGKLLFR